MKFIGGPLLGKKGYKEKMTDRLKVRSERGIVTRAQEIGLSPVTVMNPFGSFGNTIALSGTMEHGGEEEALRARAVAT